MSEPIVSSDNNGILRLQCIARCLPDCPERQWLEEGIWRVINEGIRLDEALGLAVPGWANPRQVLRHDRRGDLLCRFYSHCYRGVSLRAAAITMVTDHARLLARWGRMRPDLSLISRTPTTPRGFHELLAAEGHLMPGVSHLRQVLRRAIIRRVDDLAEMEIGTGAAAACGDAAA